MKTKTIEMWINKSDLENNVSGITALMSEKTVISDFKIKVTYEIEEPKIEITPSQLREVVGDVLVCGCGCKYIGFEKIEKELFGEIE